MQLGIVCAKQKHSQSAWQYAEKQIEGLFRIPHSELEEFHSQLFTPNSQNSTLTTDHFIPHSELEISNCEQESPATRLIPNSSFLIPNCTLHSQHFTLHTDHSIPHSGLEELHTNFQFRIKEKADIELMSAFLWNPAAAYPPMPSPAQYCRCMRA